MTSQLNPAWRRKTASSNRPARPGTRVPDDTGNAEQSTAFGRAIPFLLDTPAQAWIARELCDLLRQTGQESTLFEFPEQDGRSQDALCDALSRQCAGDAWCVVPVDSVITAQALCLDHLVLLVPATLEGVRKAYRRIKYLSERQAPEIGVVLVGPRDQHAAWRYFRKLAVGTLRYLDVPLLNLGFLPEQVTPEHGAADLHRDSFLTRISERLIGRDFFQAVPVDPAGGCA